MNLKLNETPIRTSKSFNINNIKLENIEIPSKWEEFRTVKIIDANIPLDDKIKNEKLSYGNGEILENNIDEIANFILKLEEKKKGETIELIFNFDDRNTQLINNIEIYVKHELNVIIKYETTTNKPCFHNGIIKVFGNQNSKANVTIVNLLNSSSNNFEAIENKLEDKANLKYTIVDLGSKNSVINYYSNIIGKEAKNELKTIYLGIEEQVKDLNYIAHLKGEKSAINIDVQGALNGEAKKHFKGTIDFKKGCKKAKGSESEYCMLLSNRAKSIALPILLCTEDDVEGSHAAASGKVDEQALFYVMSRGISRKEAIKLLVKANYSKIINGIKDEKLKEQILAEIDKRLG